MTGRLRWSPLSHVGHLWREHFARHSQEQRESMPSLRRLLEDSGLFDWRDDPNPNGGAITYCRLRPPLEAETVSA